MTIFYSFYANRTAVMHICQILIVGLFFFSFVRQTWSDDSETPQREDITDFAKRSLKNVSLPPIFFQLNISLKRYHGFETEQTVRRYFWVT